MMRRRPIARVAVRTTAVVGTAAVVGGHMANKQAQAAQAQQAAPEACSRSGTGTGRSGSRPHCAAHPACRPEGLGGIDRGRVRSREGQDPRLGKRSCGHSLAASSTACLMPAGDHVAARVL